MLKRNDLPSRGQSGNRTRPQNVCKALPSLSHIGAELKRFARSESMARRAYNQRTAESLLQESFAGSLGHGLDRLGTGRTRQCMYFWWRGSSYDAARWQRLLRSCLAASNLRSR
jgi:hypothetical protein